MDASASRHILAAFAMLCICSTAAAASAPAAAGVHLGVASCAGSNCHGNNATKLPAQGVLHNEYLTWQREDTHANAFRSLFTPRALAIAKRLGITDPSRSDTCIDCHADDVPVSQRGPRFSLNDGIGCEACHGGASNWIADHAVAHRSHAANMKEGMYPTDDPAARAGLCLGCHYGATDKLMTHAIMAAGHPPLLFELTTYTAIQPAHYRVDMDYRQRKHYVGPADTWAMGQVVAAQKVLDGLASRGVQSPAGAVPDFYLYDCYSCHQTLRPDSDLPAASGPQLPLAVSSLQMLGAILDASSPELAQNWAQGLAALHAAASQAALGDAIGHLQPLAAQATAFLARQSLDSRTRRRIALSLADLGTHATYPDRSLADQTVMAMTALYHGDSEAGEDTAIFGPQFLKALDAAYKALGSVSEFDTAAYRDAMLQIEKSIK
ncbi:MAG: multiheme c-type cytochrome [Gammaproteobacteria bacterium]